MRLDIYRFGRVVLLASILAAAASSCRRAQHRLSPDEPSIIEDFEAGYHGFSVSFAPELDSALPFSNSNPHFAHGGSKSLGIRVEHTAKGPGTLTVRRDVGCVPFYHRSISMFVSADASLGATGTLFVESGPAPLRSYGSSVTLSPGWNEIEVSLATSEEPRLVPPPQLDKVCALGVIFDIPQPSVGRIFLDDVGSKLGQELASSRAGLLPTARETQQVVLTVGSWESHGGNQISKHLFGVDLQSDVAGDPLLLERLRQIGPGYLKLSIYPTIGADLRRLQWFGENYPTLRLTRTIAAIRELGWEPVVSVGTVSGPYTSTISEERWLGLARTLAAIDWHDRPEVWEVDPFREGEDESIGSSALHLQSRMSAAIQEVLPRARIYRSVTGSAEEILDRMLGEDVQLDSSLTYEYRRHSLRDGAADSASHIRTIDLSLDLLRERLGPDTRIALAPQFSVSSDRRAWTALWASLYLLAAMRGVDTLYFPGLAPPFSGDLNLNRERLFAMFTLLSQVASLARSRWVPVDTNVPWVVALGLQKDFEWNRRILLVNNSASSTSIDLTLPLLPLDDVTVHGLTDTGVEQVHTVTWRTTDTWTEIDLDVPGWAVALIELHMTRLPTNAPLAVASAEPSTPSLDWQYSFIGGGPNIWTSARSDRLPTTQRENLLRAISADDAVIFDNTGPERRDALELQFRLAGEQRWLFWSVGTANGGIVEVGNRTHISMGLRIEGAPWSLGISAGDRSCPDGPTVELSKYLANATPSGGWKIVSIPLQDVLAAGCNEVSTIGFSVNDLRMPPDRIIKIYMDSIVLTSSPR